MACSGRQDGRYVQVISQVCGPEFPLRVRDPHHGGVEVFGVILRLAKSLSSAVSPASLFRQWLPSRSSWNPELRQSRIAGRGIS
jgi:hypothetical protein